MKPLLFFLLLIMTPNLSQAQDLTTHQWKNRLLIVASQQPDAPALEVQMAELEKDPAGWGERKLVVYVVLPDRYMVRHAENGYRGGQWVNSSELYEKYSPKTASFGVTLIGLDGGIKVKKSEVFSNQDLFGVIDGMPMRRSELRDGE